MRPKPNNEKLTKVEVFYPTKHSEWREWLEKNHLSKESVWVVFHRKSSEKKSLSWSEAVDEAMCFGWIDSKKFKTDPETSHQYFSKRKPNSTWSKINKEKVRKLIKSGLMTEAGLKCVRLAKENGSWSLLDEVEDLIIPKDLEMEFARQPGSVDFFLSLSKSARKIILAWVVLAKRPETRQRRVTEIAERAAKKLKPKHLQ